MLNETKTKTSTAFVAAVDDVIRQNRRLREVVASHKSVKISGPNEKRLYALGDLENGCVLHPGGLEWRVKLKQIEPCPVRELPSIEVWVEDSKQPIFRWKDNKGVYAWNNKLPFLVGLIQPGYLRIGMQIERWKEGQEGWWAVHSFQCAPISTGLHATGEDSISETVCVFFTSPSS